MKLYFAIVFLSWLTSCISGYQAGPFDLPDDGTTQNQWLNQVSSDGKERAKRETLDLIPNIPKDNLLPNAHRMQLDKSPQMPKSNTENLLRSFGVEYVRRPSIINQDSNKIPNQFPNDSKNRFNPFTSPHFESKSNPKPFNPVSFESNNDPKETNRFFMALKQTFDTLHPVSMDLKKQPSPFSHFEAVSENKFNPFSFPSKHKPEPIIHFSTVPKNIPTPFSPWSSKNKINSYTQLSKKSIDNHRFFNLFPFSSKTRQHSLSPIELIPSSRITPNPFSQLKIMSKSKFNPFRPFPLRNFPYFPPRNFDISSRSLPLTLDDSPITIEIFNDANSAEFEIGPDTKLEATKKIYNTKTLIKNQDEQNINKNSSEEGEDEKPCASDDSQKKPEHGLCIMAVLGLLILIPMITTCILKKYNPLPLPKKKTEPIRI